MMSLVDRKAEEAAFHNQLRDPELLANPALYQRLTANKKYYAVAGASMNFYKQWLVARCAGKRVLDFGCGDGDYSMLLAQNGATVVGIDISDISVDNCRRRAAKEGLSDRAEFRVMDCEALEFADDSFDIVCEAGVLHHLDLRAALTEIARVVRPDGEVICYEALGHNPLIQAYRNATPHLRTRYETEHILTMDDLELAHKLFDKVDVQFFHLLTLAAVPFRNTPLFSVVFKVLDAMDRVALKMPIIQRQAWMMTFAMSRPKKQVKTS